MYLFLAIDTTLDSGNPLKTKIIFIVSQNMSILLHLVN